MIGNRLLSPQISFMIWVLIADWVPQGTIIQSNTKKKNIVILQVTYQTVRTFYKLTQRKIPVLNMYTQYNKHEKWLY